MSALRRNVGMTEILEEDADEVLLRLLANDNEQPFHWPPPRLIPPMSDGSAEAERKRRAALSSVEAPPPMSEYDRWRSEAAPKAAERRLTPERATVVDYIGQYLSAILPPERCDGPGAMTAHVVCVLDDDVIAASLQRMKRAIPATARIAINRDHGGIGLRVRWPDGGVSVEISYDP